MLSPNQLLVVQYLLKRELDDMHESTAAVDDLIGATGCGQSVLEKAIAALEQPEPAWSLEWPTMPGWYWFYGWPWSRSRSGRPELIPIRVKQGGTLVYIAEGAFVYADVGHGMFLPMGVPAPPALV